MIETLVYKDELTEIWHGDSREMILPDGLTVTDPPFNVGYRYGEYKDNLSEDNYRDLLVSTLRPPCVVIHYPEDLCSVALMLKKSPEKMVAWVYNSMNPRQWRGVAWWGCKPDFDKDGQDYKNPNDKRIKARIERGERARLYDWWEVQQVKNVSPDKTEHPCQMPIDVMLKILRITECKLVIEPFCGSGTTLLAAKMLGIPSIGIDMDLNYCKIAAKRVSEHGSKP